MMTYSNSNFILADGRWLGQNGIGRFSKEILSRLHHTDVMTHGPSPLSLKNFLWHPYQLNQQKNKYQVYFTPGFNPIIFSAMPYVLTICDLIHLHFPGNYYLFKKIFYTTILKPSAQKAFKIITISEYSKNALLEWSGLAEDRVINVSCGISAFLTPFGKKYSVNYNYILHVGNNKPHKNMERLLVAFSLANIDKEIKLVLTAKPTPKQIYFIKKYKLEPRIIVKEQLSELELAHVYRGALAVVLPSLMEGFGLPILEAMACGVPVITSQTTSMPEVAGDAAILINPHRISAIAEGIEQVVNHTALRTGLIEKGLARAACYSWENTATRVQKVLNSVA